MTARRAADLVRALGGVASTEDARRILGDAALRRTLAAAWSVEAPSVEMLARILRKSAQGNQGSLALVQELHLGGPPSATQQRTRGVLAALHRWCLRHGDLSWFTEVSPVPHPRVHLTPRHEVGPEARTDQAPVACSWREPDGVVEVRAPAELNGHQVALLLGVADHGVELVGPGGLGFGGEHVHAELAMPNRESPRWAEPLTRRP